MAVRNLIKNVLSTIGLRSPTSCPLSLYVSVHNIWYFVVMERKEGKKTMKSVKYFKSYVTVCHQHIEVINCTRYPWSLILTKKFTQHESWRKIYIYSNISLNLPLFNIRGNHDNYKGKKARRCNKKSIMIINIFSRENN